MSRRRVTAITVRILQQFRRDRRTLALLFGAPLIILGLLGYLLRGGVPCRQWASSTRTPVRLGSWSPARSSVRHRCQRD